jgi:hypothetical protein
MPSADFSSAVNADLSAFSRLLPHAVSHGTEEISQGKTHDLPCINARFIKHIPKADGGLCCHVPARPGCTTPRIGLLFVALHFWIGLPSDPASRRRPCPSPNLRLRENLVSGLSPDWSCAMPGTHGQMSGDAQRRPSRSACYAFPLVPCSIVISNESMKAVNDDAKNFNERLFFASSKELAASSPEILSLKCQTLP